MILKNISPSGSDVDAPLAGGLVPHEGLVDVPDAAAKTLIATGHFRKATKAETEAAKATKED